MESVRFEAGSELREIGDDAFERCAALSVIWIPAALREILQKHEALLKNIDDEEK
jgi:hypothetical protein